MSLTGTTPRLTSSDRALEHRHLGIIAWFDGWTQAHGGKPHDYPRRLTPGEATSWREGWAEGKRESRCHQAHGFALCSEEAHR